MKRICEHCGIEVAPNDDLVEALESIVNWSKAYPLKVFPEPDFEKVAKVLSDAGLSLDAVSASNMRHVITEVGAIAAKALSNGHGGEG